MNHLSSIEEAGALRRQRRMSSLAPITRLSVPIFALAMLICPLPSWAGSSKPMLTAEKIKTMEEGWVVEHKVKVKGDQVARWTAMGIVEDKPEAVLYVLLGFDKYKHFIDHMKDTRITKRKGLDSYVVLETKLPWPVKDAWVYFKVTRKHLPGRVFELHFNMINGTMKRYGGWARVEPWNKGGSRSLLTYSLLFEPKTNAPASAIDRGVWSITIHVVKRIRLRLKALRKYKKVPKAWGG